MNTVILALIGTISAVQINREPLISKDASPLEIWEFPKYKDINVDYKVADFGKAHEIMYTENNIKMAEAAAKHKWTIAKDAKWPAGVDTDIEFKLLQTDAEREPLLSANASELEVHQTPAYAGYPVDYKVADFGKSHEIMYTENNIKNAEKTLSHNLGADWGFTKSTVATPRNYKVADFGLDEDIKNSLGDLE